MEPFGWTCALVVGIEAVRRLQVAGNGGGVRNAPRGRGAVTETEVTP
ncbi:MAG: hypothetical protein JNM83_20825 [Myxococcales bacterium]|nr:hypothetical protein [Myxococcales bacterium]